MRDLEFYDRWGNTNLIAYIHCIYICLKYRVNLNIEFHDLIKSKLEVNVIT